MRTPYFYTLGAFLTTLLATAYLGYLITSIGFAAETYGCALLTVLSTALTFGWAIEAKKHYRKSNP